VSSELYLIYMNPLQNSNHPFLIWLKNKLTKKEKLNYDRTKLIICVWNKHQVIPATIYCQSLKESSQILVCKDASKQRDSILSNGDRAIVYNF
jgi:hypothetical protein